MKDTKNPQAFPRSGKQEWVIFGEGSTYSVKCGDEVIVDQLTFPQAKLICVAHNAADRETATDDNEKRFIQVWLCPKCAHHVFDCECPATDDKLLPCPFCGSCAEFGDDGEGGEFITCTNQMCLASSQIKYPCKTDVKPLLTEVWNNRVQVTATDDRVKEQLTPHECAEQFRMYARANAGKPDAVHQLNFCADFLDEFCGVKEQGSHAAGQEWTHEKLQGLLQISNEDRYVADHAFESTLDEINAALADERNEVRIMTNQCVQLRQELADEREKTNKTRELLQAALNEQVDLSRGIGLMQKDLLQAQAAIAAALKAWFPAKHNIESYERLLNVDLSALDKHNNEIIGNVWRACEQYVEQVRKPMVERLQESNGVLKVLLNFSDEVKRVHSTTLCEVIDKNTAALAKVKEGKCSS